MSHPFQDEAAYFASIKRAYGRANARHEPNADALEYECWDSHAFQTGAGIKVPIRQDRSGA